MSELRELFSADLCAALEAFVDERITATLAAVSKDSPWLTLESAARYAHVSTRTLSRAIERGQLRSTCLGRRRLINRADLDAFLEAARL